MRSPRRRMEGEVVYCKLVDTREDVAVSLVALALAAATSLMVLVV